MFKIKDFYFKQVYNVKGEKIGKIEDVCIDFFNSKITGFKVTNHKLFSKKNYVSISDVIEIGEEIVVNNCAVYDEGLCFKEIKNMEIITKEGELKGVLEDIIVDLNDYTLKGLIISPGFLETLTKGKEIALLENCVLGDNYILYSNKTKVVFKSMPYNMEKKYELQKI